MQIVALLLLLILFPVVGRAESPRVDRGALADDYSVSTTTVAERTSHDLRDPSDVFDGEPVRRFKKQAVQNVTLSGGWLASTDGDGLSNGFLSLSVGLGVPLGSFDNILGVTPSLRVDMLDADSRFDVPAELYATGVQFFWRKALGKRWSVMAIGGPSIRSDFTTSDKAFRLFGLGLLTWQYLPDELSLSFGAVYLGRADLPLLPAVGATWTPRPTIRLELRFPESRLAYRIAKRGAECEVWAYLTAGLGGNTWAVTRRDGRTDELSLRDWRVRFGIEQIVDGGGGWFIDVGYAFARRIEYERAGTEISLADGVLLRAGWKY